MQILFKTQIQKKKEAFATKIVVVGTQQNLQMQFRKKAAEQISSNINDDDVETFSPQLSPPSSPKEAEENYLSFFQLFPSIFTRKVTAKKCL